jgi:hypothetical protein
MKSAGRREEGPSSAIGARISAVRQLSGVLTDFAPAKDIVLLTETRDALAH